MFIDNFHPQQDHYQILKYKVDSNEWNSYVDEIVLELKSKNRYFELNRISDLFQLLKKYGKLENNITILSFKYTLNKINFKGKFQV